ncbi:MAG: hypothetical protein GY788_23755, partial [bacterium]|nr:hypothetical protein [bacterium]
MSTTEPGYLAQGDQQGNVFNQQAQTQSGARRKSRTWAEIESIIQQRVAQNTHMINQMIEVRDRYNGDYVIPILDNEDNPDVPDTAPKLIQEGIDHVAMRAGSIMPNIACPAVTRGNRKDTGPRSREYARVRERILHATWKENRFYELGLRRFYRHLQGYATGAIQVFPNFTTGIPQIVARDPLTTYPEIKSAEDYTPVRDCAFVYGKSAEWIRATFPESRQENGGPVGPVKGDNRELWDMVEWIDEDICVFGILGPRYNWYSSAEPRSPLATVPSNLELRRYPNRTGRCTVVAPARVTLDRVASQVSQIVGTVDLMAHMQALEVMAAEKAIFPDKYI